MKLNPSCLLLIIVFVFKDWNYKLLLLTVVACCIFINGQKQPFRGVLSKRCSENMPQMYRRTPMPKCDFSKVVHLKLHNGMGVVLYICGIFSEHLFIIKHLWRAASIHNISRYFCEISICDDSQLFTINLIWY